MSFTYDALSFSLSFFFEKYNFILRKKRLAINFDSLTSVRDKKIEKKTRKKDRKLTNEYTTNTGEEKCTRVNRVRRKSSVPAPLSLHLVRGAFGSLERIKASFSATNESSYIRRIWP